MWHKCLMKSLASLKTFASPLVMGKFSSTLDISFFHFYQWTMKTEQKTKQYPNKKIVHRNTHPPNRLSRLWGGEQREGIQLFSWLTNSSAQGRPPLYCCWYSEAQLSVGDKEFGLTWLSSIISSPLLIFETNWRNFEFCIPESSEIKYGFFILKMVMHFWTFF